MQPNSFVATTTNQYLAPSWVDGVLRDNRLFSIVLNRMSKFEGSQSLQPFKVNKGVSSVAFSGFDELPITQKVTTINGVFFPSFVATNVALAGSDLSTNKTQMKLLDLMQTQMASRSQDAADDMGNYLYGNGSADNGKAPSGLSNTIDNGAVASTYAGLSRATYSMLNSYITNAASNVITLVQMRKVWNQISDGPIAPDYILASYDVWAYVENLLNTVIRNFNITQRDQTGRLGFEALEWNGMKIYRDKKAPEQTMYFINSRFLEWKNLEWYAGTPVNLKSVDIEGNVYESSEYSPRNAYRWTGWISALNGAAINGFMIIGGQLVSTNPSRLAALNSIQGN